MLPRRKKEVKFRCKISHSLKQKMSSLAHRTIKTKEEKNEFIIASDESGITYYITYGQIFMLAPSQAKDTYDLRVYLLMAKSTKQMKQNTHKKETTKI